MLESEKNVLKHRVNSEGDGVRNGQAITNHRDACDGLDHGSTGRRNGFQPEGLMEMGISIKVIAQTQKKFTDAIKA